MHFSGVSEGNYEKHNSDLNPVSPENEALVII
jgi:hypothetical protein